MTKTCERILEALDQWEGVDRYGAGRPSHPQLERQILHDCPQDENDYDYILYPLGPKFQEG